MSICSLRLNRAASGAQQELMRRLHCMTWVASVQVGWTAVAKTRVMLSVGWTNVSVGGSHHNRNGFCFVKWVLDQAAAGYPFSSNVSAQRGFEVEDKIGSHHSLLENSEVLDCNCFPFTIYLRLWTFICWHWNWNM